MTGDSHQNPRFLQLRQTIQDSLGTSSRTQAEQVLGALFAGDAVVPMRSLIWDTASDDVIFIDTKKAFLAGAAVLAPQTAALIDNPRVLSVVAFVSAVAAVAGLKIKTILDKPCASICLLLCDAPGQRMSEPNLRAAYCTDAERRSTPAVIDKFDDALQTLRDLGIVRATASEVQLRQRIQLRWPRPDSP